MKKIIILLVTLLSFINVCALGRNQFVMDGAELLSKDTENYILEYSNYLKDQVGVDFAVITIDVGEVDLPEYTEKLYDSYHVSNKGIIIVADKNSRGIQIQVGTRFSDVISDEVINDYIEQYMVGYLKNEEWDEGIKNGYTAFYKLICNYYDIDSEVLEVYDADSFLNEYRTSIISVIVFICTFLGYGLIKYYRNRYIKRNNDKMSNILNDFMFFACVFINVELFIVAYYFSLKDFLMVFAIEMVSIISAVITEGNAIKEKRKEAYLAHLEEKRKRKANKRRRRNG